MKHAQEVMANAVSHLVRVKGQVAHLQSGATPNQQLSEEVGCLSKDSSPCMSFACVLHHLNVGLLRLADGKADAVPMLRCALGHSTIVIVVLMPWDPSVISKPGAFKQRLKVHLLS